MGVVQSEGTGLMGYLSNLLKLVNVISIVSVIILVWFAVSWTEVILKNLNIEEENRVRMSWNAFDVMFDIEK